jgi:hypothetical protein
MTMRKVRLIEAAVWLLFSFLLMGSQMKLEPEQELLHVFHSVGGRPELYVLHFGSRTASSMTKEKIEQLANKLQVSLGTASVKKNVETDGIRYTATGWVARGLLVQWVIINDEPSRFKVRPYLSLQLIGKGEPGADFKEARDRCTEVLHENGIIPSYHFSVQGTTSVAHGDSEKILARVARALKAKEVEEMRTDRTISLSLFSPQLSSGIRTGGGVMNVQAAARMNHDTHRLILTLGTPIITIEY